MALIELKDVNKNFGEKCILENLNIEIDEGEFVGVKGRSGRGKTTLLNIIGLQEQYDGEMFLDGNKVNIKDKRYVRRMLKEEIGYLFQNFALIDDLNVYENLKIVMDKKCEDEIGVMTKALNAVGLTKDMLYQSIYKCSGGEQQRIAVARLILKDCKIILADEPTGSLDSKNAELIMKLLVDLNNQGKTIIMVSHDERMLSYCKRVIDL